jgi:hypothetical protein
MYLFMSQAISEKHTAWPLMTLDPRFFVDGSHVLKKAIQRVVDPNNLVLFLVRLFSAPNVL